MFGRGLIGEMMEDMHNMERRMDAALSRASLLGGGAGFGDFPEAMDALANAGGRGEGGGGLGNGGYSYSSSSYSYSSRGGVGPDGQPKSVEYSSSTRGAQRAGEEKVTETHRSYRDSSGYEKIGVSRTVGDRGRQIIRDRDARTGRETCKDNLRGVSDGDAFDREWASASSSGNLLGAARHMPPLISGGATPGAFSGAPKAVPPPPAPTAAERRVAAAGRQHHARQNQRLMEEARRARAATDGKLAPARVPSSRRTGTGIGFDVAPASAASSLHSRQALGGGNEFGGGFGRASAVPSSRGGGSALARNLARQEADRFWT